MKERKKVSDANARMLDVQGLCSYISMGSRRAVEFARKVGAEKRIGRRCIYDKKILDRALDEMEE